MNGNLVFLLSFFATCALNASVLGVGCYDYRDHRYCFGNGLEHRTASPKWNPKREENPPLSAARALKQAHEFIATMPTDKDHSWEFEDLALVDVDGWLWRAHFRLQTNASGGLHDYYMGCYILLDGTVIEPVVTPAPGRRGSFVDFFPTPPPSRSAGGVQFFHFQGGVRYTFAITSEQQAVSPKWDPKRDDNPPLSPAEALKQANKFFDKVVSPERPKWEFEDVSLIDTGGWLWRARFVKIFGSGPLVHMGCYILMDGTVIEPVESAEKDDK
jgi:hypothetical protein